MTKINKYFEEAVDDVYEILVSNKHQWGIFFTQNERKIQMLDNIIKFYENLNQYEKCDKILNLKNKIIKNRISEN
jgi:hypothetical protein